MSFFTTSTGENAAQGATGEFNAGGGADFSPIPKDTRVLAMCDEAKINSFGDDRYINLKWTVAQPAEHKNRVVFQKIYALDLRQDVLKKKGADAANAYRDKALRMLSAIDANAGGKLAAAGVEPTDLALQTSLTAKPMVLMLDVWDIDGKTGNWVREVSPYNPKQAATSKTAPAAKPKPATAPAPQSTGTIDIDGDIPFAPMAHTRALMLAM